MADQAKSVDGDRVGPGRRADVKVVQNQTPHPMANEFYLAIPVQWPNGTEETLLFTEREVAEARHRAWQNPEDVPKAAYLLEHVRDLLD